MTHRDSPDCGSTACYWHGKARREQREAEALATHTGHELVAALGSTWCRTCTAWATVAVR